MTIRIEAAGRTHVGLVRRRNEDAFYVGKALFAVADGLGGHVAGDVASETVIGALRPYDRGVEPAALANVLSQGVNAASSALHHQVEAQPHLAGMGTTLVALLCSGPAAVLANVGDSRAYLHRGCASTTQITEDHTFAHLVAHAAHVPALPERLSRFLDGRTDGRSPDLTPQDLRVGDRFLLCSDGLSSYVPLDQIHAVLIASGGPEAATNRLVDLTLDRGSPDNITVIIIDIHLAA